MDDQPVLPEHHSASSAAARVALHQLLQRLAHRFWLHACGQQDGRALDALLPGQ